MCTKYLISKRLMDRRGGRNMTEGTLRSGEGATCQLSHWIELLISLNLTFLRYKTEMVMSASQDYCENKMRPNI